MAIDDKFDAIKQAYPETSPYLPADLAAYMAKLFLPEAAVDALGTVCERLDKTVQQERAEATLKAIVDELRSLDKEKVSKEQFDAALEAMQLAVRYDAEEFNERKRERYIKIIGTALRSEKLIDDLASFIQDVERLGERDIIALRVLNRVMNAPRDTDKLRDFHPNDFIQRRQELAVEMAKALGGKYEGSSFSREQGYDACNRLQAFGLAHEIDVAPRQVPVGEYCFRPSIRGLMLLKLLGEEVPNQDIYQL
jgi:hypothetical protein